jgi:hypothetical protein
MENSKTTPVQILSHILDCGSSDIEFICSLLDSFNIAFDEFDWMGLDANQAIGEIFNCAVSNTDINQDDNDVNIYTNYLDSHLYINDTEMYSAEDLKAFNERESFRTTYDD